MLITVEVHFVNAKLWNESIYYFCYYSLNILETYCSMQYLAILGVILIIYIQLCNRIGRSQHVRETYISHSCKWITIYIHITGTFARVGNKHETKLYTDPLTWQVRAGHQPCTAPVCKLFSSFDSSRHDQRCSRHDVWSSANVLSMSWISLFSIFFSSLFYTWKHEDK